MASKGKKNRQWNISPYLVFGIAVAIIFVAIVLQLVILLPDHVPEEQVEDIELQDNLELAKKSFNKDGFHTEQIFGDTPIWGSLNSGHYFGLKLSSPDSVETSLMWFKNQLNSNRGLNIRHLCDQNDDIKSYSWDRHDFYTFGQQHIIDQGYKIKTTYIKNNPNSLSWIAKVEIDSEYENTTLKPLSVIQYVSINSNQDYLKLEKYESELNNSTTEVFTASGTHKHLGSFSMSIKIDCDEENFILGSYLSDHIDRDRYPTSSFIMSRMLSTIRNRTQLFLLPGTAKMKNRQESGEKPNLIAYQMTLMAPASITIEFKSDKNPEIPVDYDSSLSKKLVHFDQEFSRIFPPDPELSKQLSSNAHIDDLAKVALSNMIGSIGYFYGHSLIGSGVNPNKVELYGPIQLLTGVPSRSFFPRGFLWDEGFHNLLISEWNPELSNKIIVSWFDIMNINGWIPREVILGVESMRRVPNEFIVQRITNANPPSMFIVIERMLDKRTLHKSTLEKVYPKLKVWYDWFNVTQFGSKSSVYRWRGRDEFSVKMLNPKTLTSGLDDYPRASHPSSSEYHIDLRCWMGLAARTLKKLSDMMDDGEFSNIISMEAEKLVDNKLMDQLHWSEEHKMYCDFGHNNENAELVLVTKTRRIQNSDMLETYQELERHSTGHAVFGCVPEFGYVSLFPMLHNILDHRSDKLGILLARLRDENELWSQFGIRSLSKSSRYYNKYNTMHDKPYWRGPIWLNLNYLILSSLKSYSRLEGPHQEKCKQLYSELRKNLVENVLNQYSKTGYLWENYDDETGQGRGSHPFTGWSSLILLVLTNNFD